MWLVKYIYYTFSCLQAVSQGLSVPEKHNLLGDYIKAKQDLVLFYVFQCFKIPPLSVEQHSMAIFLHTYNLCTTYVLTLTIYNNVTDMYAFKAIWRAPQKWRYSYEIFMYELKCKLHSYQNGSNKQTRSSSNGVILWAKHTSLI